MRSRSKIDRNGRNGRNRQRAITQGNGQTGKQARDRRVTRREWLVQRQGHPACKLLEAEKGRRREEGTGVCIGLDRVEVRCVRVGRRGRGDGYAESRQGEARKGWKGSGEASRVWVGDAFGWDSGSGII